jgi:hypothetical protein
VDVVPEVVGGVVVVPVDVVVRGVVEVTVEAVPVVRGAPVEFDEVAGDFVVVWVRCFGSGRQGRGDGLLLTCCPASVDGD